MGHKSLVFALPAILLVGAFAGCLEEKVEFGDLDDKFRGALGGTSDGSTSTGDQAESQAPAESEAPAESPPPAQSQAPAQSDPEPEPEPEPEPAPQPTGACDAQVDKNGAVLQWTSKNAASRINSKEGILLEFQLNTGDVTDYGIATTALSTDSVCNLDSSTVRYWQGWSKREGTDQYELLEDGNPGAASNVFQSVAGWLTHVQPRDEWPGPSGPDHVNFRYFAYARTADGTLHYTSLEDAHEGKGIVGVYLRHRTGRFAMEQSELAPEGEF